MSIAPSSIVARVSRRELALNRYVWLATGGMFLVFTLSIFVIAFLPLGFDRQHLLIFAGVLLLVSITLLRTEPPAIGTVENHVVLASIYLFTSAAMFAFHPGGSATLGAAMFVGPLTAVRLLDRREITAHYLAATFFLLLPAFLGVVDQATILASVTLIPAMWVLGGCVVVVPGGRGGPG